ncbi:hypothetical protein [Streptomyces sp. NPDC059349]|uniref:hypothetical protein n=1 Tax=Streptomyces sp. NPDC059349 TaxID=3346808 RepID=UPI0036AC1DAD
MTGKPGTQTWYESVHVTCRSPESEAARKAENERIYAPRRERAEKANTEPATPVQAGGRAGSTAGTRQPNQRGKQEGRRRRHT